MRVLSFWFTVAIALSVSPSFAQVTPATTPDEGVTITGDARAEALKKMAGAERTAGEARRMFSAPSRDTAAACRKASEADLEYAEAIRAANQLVKDETSPVKERTEERIKRVKDERENLDKLHDRFCRGGDIARPPVVRNAIPGRNRP